MIIERRRKSRIGRFFTLILIGAIFLYIGTNFFLGNYSNKRELVSPLLNNPISTPSPKIYPKDSLEGVVQSALEGTKGMYAVAIKNLKNGQNYYFNEHQVFDAGSLYKLWIMAEVFDQIKKGNMKEADILSDSISNLNKKFKILEENAELKEGDISLNVADALKQMITISHNYAALLLTQKIKLSSVDLFLQKNGFSESSVGTDGDSPKTTAYDIALFFEKLYKGELTSQDYTSQMIELLKMQQLNDKLPMNLPDGVVIAHKTGEIDYFSHDGGIVFSPKGEYIIVVLSKTDNLPATEGRISQISKGVYDYFEK